MTAATVRIRRPLGRLIDYNAAALVAAALAVVWLIVDPRSPDLAAQVYRVDLFHDFGFQIWDNNWYAGHHLPGYSLVFPPLAQLVNLRVLGVLAVVASAAMFAMLVRDYFGPRTHLAAAWFAVAAAGDLWIGRLTFALGVTVALAAALAMARDKPALAGVLAGVCAATSPVAGLFLALAGVAYALATREFVRGALLAAPALVIVLAMAALFPEGGVEPFPATSFAVAACSTVAFLVLVPREQRLLRIGAGLYLAAVVVSLLPVTPMGSNIVRLGVLLAGPLLICAAVQRSHAGRISRRWELAVAVAALAFAAWTVAGPVRESLKSAGDPSVRASYYQPVLDFLSTHDTAPVRIEVPFTRAHWETVYIGNRFPLARGWERQLDKKYDKVFNGPITAEAYHAWLSSTAVTYVALPDAPLDDSSTGEAQLIHNGLPFLRPVLTTAHWHVYRVIGHDPIAQGPGTLAALTRDGFVLQADAPGTFTVRVRYTPYWTFTQGAGCVTATPDGWTSVTATSTGPIGLTAQFSLRGMLRASRTCTQPLA